jgi:protein SCO1
MTDTNPRKQSETRSPWQARLAWSLLILVSLGITLAAFSQFSRKAGEALPISGELKPFEFTERSGKAFGSRELKGKVWVADFIFTRCGGPCPVMSAHLSKMQQMILDEPGICLVSFSLDPTYDTPQVLRDYAQHFKAIEGKWFFLTGKTDETLQLAQEGFKITAQKNHDATPSDAVLHGTHFILVDQQGRLRGYYDSGDANLLPKIVKDAKALLKD